MRDSIPNSGWSRDGVVLGTDAIPDCLHRQKTPRVTLHNPAVGHPTMRPLPTCRICMRIQDLKSIFQTWPEQPEQCNTAQKIRKVFPTLRKVSENDDFSQFICMTCLQQLDGALEFLQKGTATEMFQNNYPHNRVSTRKQSRSVATMTTRVLSSHNNQSSSTGTNFSQKTYEAKDLIQKTILQSSCTSDEVPEWRGEQTLFTPYRRQQLENRVNYRSPRQNRGQLVGPKAATLLHSTASHNLWDQHGIRRETAQYLTALLQSDLQLQRVPKVELSINNELYCLKCKMTSSTCRTCATCGPISITLQKCVCCKLKSRRRHQNVGEHTTFLCLKCREEFRRAAVSAKKKAPVICWK